VFYFEGGDRRSGAVALSKSPDGHCASVASPVIQKAHRLWSPAMVSFNEGSALRVRGPVRFHARAASELPCRVARGK